MGLPFAIGNTTAGPPWIAEPAPHGVSPGSIGRGRMRCHAATERHRCPPEHANPGAVRCGCLADRAARAQTEPGASAIAPCSTPSPRRFGENQYASDPRPMIERTLITRSTTVIASACD